MNAAARTGIGVFALFYCVGVVALAAVCAYWPLTVWAFTLALFGVPHALVELRWVGRRYGGRDGFILPGGFVLFLVVVLVVICGARLLALASGWTTASLATSELVLGMFLVGGILLHHPRRCPLRTIVSAAVLAVLVWGAVLAPIDALVLLALVHNLTPIGLIADRLRDRDLAAANHRPWIAAAIVCFVVVPFGLGSGAVPSWLGLGSSSSTMADAAGGATLGLALSDGITAFVPTWFPHPHALDLLRAAAFLQCMHYVAVLAILPRLGPHAAAKDVALAVDRPFLGLVVGLGIAFLLAFLLDFRESKASYGVLAAVHVWLEFPALLLALTPRLTLRPAL